MSNYEYLGCVTGFSENDTVTVWQPPTMPMHVLRDAVAYTNRLVDVELLVGSGNPVNPNIQCIPTSLTIDNTTDLPTGLYQLTLKINDDEPRVITIDRTENWVATLKKPVTPAIMFGLMLAEVQSIAFYWINRPKFYQWYWDTEEAKSEINYSGVSGANPNTLTILPTQNLNGALDLYQYLAKHGEPSLTIHSCGVYEANPF